MRRSRTAALILTMAAFAGLGIGRAAAFDTGSWDGVSFDQGADSARGRARVAGAVAASLAGKTTIVGKAATPRVTLGQSNCQVNIGGIWLQNSSVNSLKIVANTVVHGDIITVCR